MLLKVVFNSSSMNSDVLKYPLKNVEYFILNEVEARDICKTQKDGEELIKEIIDKFQKIRVYVK